MPRPGPPYSPTYALPFSGNGLDPAVVAWPGWRGPVEGMAGLVRKSWASFDDEWMGYTVRPAAPGSFAFACELALEGRDVADGLRRAARFYNLRAAGIETRITASDGGLAVEVRFAEPERDPDPYFSEFWTIL